MHVKDYLPGRNDPVIGSSTFGWPAFIRAARSAGTEWFIIEHDSPDREEVRTCLDRFRSFVLGQTASCVRQQQRIRAPSIAQIRHHKEHQGNDRIDSYELYALVPVRLSVSADQRSEYHTEKKRANFSTAEREIQRLWRDEMTCDHEERRDKQRNLNRTAQRDADGLIRGGFVLPSRAQIRFRQRLRQWRETQIPIKVSDMPSARTSTFRCPYKRLTHPRGQLRKRQPG